MSDQYSRPFSKNYSGLISQTVIGACIALVTFSIHEISKRKRRGKRHGDGLGSRESWEFGYLYQGRSWAKNPSPPLPGGLPLSWVLQAVKFPDDRLRQSRGIDATLYIRFLRGCFWFTLLQTFTTFLILFPIHVKFSDDGSSPRSMTRALISSLVTTARGRSLLWLHVSLLFWLTLSWIVTLIWICYGTFRMRAQQIEDVKKRVADAEQDKGAQCHTHPHPQYNFQDVPNLRQDHVDEGLRLRSVMISNVPPRLRSEKELRAYFEHFMSRPIDKPSVGLPSSTQPGFFNRSFTYLFNRAKRIPVHLLTARPAEIPSFGKVPQSPHGPESEAVPVIERVVIARKMTTLVSLLGRREEILRRLETAHIALARRTLLAVKAEITRRQKSKATSMGTPGISPPDYVSEVGGDLEQGLLPINVASADEDHMTTLIEALVPFVDELDLQQPSLRSKTLPTITHAFRKLRAQGSESEHDPDNERNSTLYPPVPGTVSKRHLTIWEALLSLKRAALDAYQPLIRLSNLFRGQTIPAIDYYTTKLAFLTALITEQRAKSVTDFDPVSTAFVTFVDPRDAKRACKYLAVHPNNPLACLVTMAPGYDDIDWIRVMKSNFEAEFIKDWVVNIGVWAFTIFWLFFVTLLIGLVSIEKISTFLPSLKAFLDRHVWGEELIQSVLPTLLVALLALLISPLLLLIAKKAHTITTLSALHDLIMTRYYKFLVVNVLVFFCVGTAAVQSFLSSLKSSSHILNVIALSFPTAGPFYVGWLIFTVAIHAGFELALFGLPLIMYPSTRRQVTPRKRAVGVRPRTFNYYYWLPTHLLVLHTLLLFSVLNPFIIPFGCFYYFVEIGIIKNQLIHVYSKSYEGNGQVLLIRMVRYSLDGLMLSQAVFLAYMAVLQNKTNVSLSCFLILFTAVVKICITRVCRAQFEEQDISEGLVTSGLNHNGGTIDSGRPSVQEMEPGTEVNQDSSHSGLLTAPRTELSILTWRLRDWVNFSYSSIRQRIHKPTRRPPIPFGSSSNFLRFDSEPLEPPGPARLKFRDAETLPSRKVTGENNTSIKDGSATLPTRLERNTEERSKHRHRIAEPQGPVSRHPPPIPWDDQLDSELPYDNPYYTRAISNVLWLPRDPFGILNLDDTVDMQVSLTTEKVSGQLGTWLGAAGTTRQSDPSFPTSTLENPSSQRRYTGSEEIELPPAIAKRVQNIESESEIDHTDIRKPSLFGRKSSSGSGMEMHGIKPSPSIMSLPVPFRSLSSGMESQSSQSPRVTTQPLGRSVSESPRLSRPIDIQSQSHLLSTTQQLGIDDFLSIHHTSSRNNTISAQEAVNQEVIAEEEAQNELKQDEEKNQTVKQQHWLTSWLFAKL